MRTEEKLANKDAYHGMTKSVKKDVFCQVVPVVFCSTKGDQNFTMYALVDDDCEGTLLCDDVADKLTQCQQGIVTLKRSHTSSLFYRR